MAAAIRERMNLSFLKWNTPEWGYPVIAGDSEPLRCASKPELDYRNLPNNSARSRHALREIVAVRHPKIAANPRD
jgi:hypothetical protein